MSIKSNNANYSAQLEQYRQSGNICAFLSITMIEILMENNLLEKFAALEEAGFRLSNNSFLEELVPSSILRQFTVARCSYESQLSFINSSQKAQIKMHVETQQLIMCQLILPSSVAMLAVLFNISLLIVTARKISMDTVCNWLLAFDSFCQIPALLPLVVNFVAVFLSFDSVDPSLCLISLMLSTGSSYASFLAVFFMSLERLLIVMMPMRMSQISEKTVKHCSLLAVLTCVCFGVALVLIIFNVLTNINAEFGRFLYCNSWFFSDATNVHYVSHVMLSLALLNYVFIAGLICWRRIYVPSTQTDSNNNAAYSRATYRMLRSVFLILLVFMIGWLFGLVLQHQITQPFIDKLSKRIGHVFTTDLMESNKFSTSINNWVKGLAYCLFPIAAGINAPMLIINNSDYREAYKNTLAPLLICRRNRNSPAAVGPMFT